MALSSKNSSSNFSSPFKKSSTPTEASDEEQLCFSGYLEKKGPLMRQWKRFYCELTSSNLKLYTKAVKYSNPNVVFKITHESKVTPVMQHDNRTDNLFSITTRAQGMRKTIYFSTPDFNTQLQWIDALDRVIKLRIAVHNGTKTDNDRDGNSDVSFVPDPNAPILTKDHISIMSKVLNAHPELYTQMRSLRTARGFIFDDVIQSGLDSPNLHVGCIAPDEDSYLVFKPFFDKILELGFTFNPMDRTKSDLTVGHINVPNGIDGRYIIATKLSIVRNIGGLPMAPYCTRAERRKIEEIVKAALSRLSSDLIGQYQSFEVLGEYSVTNQNSSIGGKSNTNNNQSQSVLGMINSELEHLPVIDEDDIVTQPPSDSYLNLIGGTHDWAESRGVYFNTNKSVAVLVNYSNHIKIFSTDKTGNFVTVFDRLTRILAAIEIELVQQGGRFAYDNHFGFLATCPSQIGSGLNALAILKLPKLSSDMNKFVDICNRLGLNYKPAKSIYGKHTWDVSIEYRTNLSEAELVQGLINGVKRLVSLEKGLDEGPGVFQALLQQTPKVFIPPNIVSGSTRAILGDVSKVPHYSLGSDVPELQSQHTSLMASYLDPDLFESLSHTTTPNGYRLSDAIRVGVDIPEDEIGFTAGDEDSWELFHLLLRPILEHWHSYTPGSQVLEDLDIENISGIDLIDSSYVVSSKIEVVRNLREFSLGPIITREQRRAVEQIITSALKELEDQVDGKYYPIKDISEREESQMMSHGIMFHKPKPSTRLWVSGCARDWPDARGIFVNKAHNMAVWINEEDHIKLIVSEKSGDLSASINRFFPTLQAFTHCLRGTEVQLQHSEKFGYLSVCPSRAGTGIRMSVMLRLAFLGKEESHLRTICKSIGLECEKITDHYDISYVDDIEIAVTQEDYIWKVWNRVSMGITEVTVFQNVIEGVHTIIECEKRMETGVDITQCLPKNTLHPAFPYLTQAHVSDTARLLSKHPDLFTELYEEQTSTGYTIDHVIQSAVDIPSIPVGCVAFDEECYASFKGLYDGLLLRRCGFRGADTAKSDIGPQHLTNGEYIDSKYLLSTRISIARNISGLPLASGLTRAERRKIEEILKLSFNELIDVTHGRYNPLEEMSEDEIYSLMLYGLAFKKPEMESFQHQLHLDSDWPDARGIFYNADKTISIFVNEEEHVKIVSADKGGNIMNIFARLFEAVSSLEKGLHRNGVQFMRDSRYGFLMTDPSQVGTGLEAVSVMNLDVYGRQPDRLHEACSKLGLLAKPYITPFVADTEGLWEISVQHRVNMSEVELVQTLVNGVIKLILIEKWIESHGGHNTDERIDLNTFNIPDKYTPVVIDTFDDNYNSAMEISHQTRGLQQQQRNNSITSALSRASSISKGFVRMKSFSPTSLGSDFPRITNAHTSLMAKYLVPDYYDRLKKITTSNGYKLSDAIRIGVDIPNDEIGFTAGDEESFTLFQKLLEPILEGYHNCQPKHDATKPTDNAVIPGADKLDHSHIRSVRVEVSRNIHGYALLPCIKREHRRQLESQVVMALRELDGYYAGEYIPLSEKHSIFEKKRNDIIFTDATIGSKLWLSGCYRDFPDSRGIFINESQNFVVWVNEEDHLKFIHNYQGNVSDLGHILSTAHQSVNMISQILQSYGMSFMSHEKFGYCTLCPSRIGTGIKIFVQLQLNHLGQSDKYFKKACSSFNLDGQIIHETDNSNSNNSNSHSNHYNTEMKMNSQHGGSNVIAKISNHTTIGLSEWKLYQNFISGLNEIISIEKRLENGADIVEVMATINPPQQKKVTTAKQPAVGSSSQPVSPSSAGRETGLSEGEHRAMLKCGVSRSSIYLGERVGKKMNKESSYKKRFIWIDASDGSFHWSKVMSKNGKNKSVTLNDMQTVTGPMKSRGKLGMFGGTKDLVTWNLLLKNGKSIDIMMDPSAQDGMGAAREWTRALQFSIKEEET